MSQQMTAMLRKRSVDDIQHEDLKKKKKKVPNPPQFSTVLNLSGTGRLK